MIGLTLEGGTFTFAQNNVNLTAADVAAAKRRSCPATIGKLSGRVRATARTAGGCSSTFRRLESRSRSPVLGARVRSRPLSPDEAGSHTDIGGFRLKSLVKNFCQPPTPFA